MLELEELLNKNWLNLGIDKNKKKSLQQEFVLFIKTTKANSKCRTNYPGRMKKSWNMTDHNKFFCLHYPHCSKTYFQFIIMVVKFYLITNCC